MVLVVTYTRNPNVHRQNHWIEHLIHRNEEASHRSQNQDSRCDESRIVTWFTVELAEGVRVVCIVTGHVNDKLACVEGDQETGE